MRVRDAAIRGFGRLVDRRIRFAPQVQIIVGENEAGKSTLHKFILAMLFGLKRENRRRREYLEEYELFRPWSGAPFAGRLIYELDDGRSYEISRDFDRNSESVQIHDAVSGRDLSGEFPLDARKERNVMQSQLRLTRQLFEGTTSMGQLAGRPSAASVAEFRERVQGLVDSGDEGTSVRRALETLHGLREQFGSERTPTRGVGLLIKQRKQLQSELEAARVRHSEVVELHRRRAQIREDYARAEAAWRELRTAELQRERHELQRRAERAAQLEEQLQPLRERVAGFADVENIDVASYAPARAHAAAIEALESDTAEGERRAVAAQHEADRLHALETELATALGDLDQARFADLTRLATRLREHLGALREVRQRRHHEQRRNREVVEALRAHHGRDWTRDEFLAELATRRRDAADRTAEPVQREAQRSLDIYAGQRRRFQWSLALSAVLLVGGVTLSVWNPAAWLLWVRVLVAAVASVGAALLAVRELRRLVAQRDHARAVHVQALRLDRVRREARQWLADVLSRNDVETLEALYEARRDYESLRAEAARRAEESPGRELRDVERDFERLASRLRAQLAGCDLGAVAELQARASEAEQRFLPAVVDETPDDPLSDDADETRLLLADLAQLPYLRNALTWLERIREQRAALEQQRDALQADLSQRRARLDGERQALTELLLRNGARDVADLARRVERYTQRQAALADYLPLQREQEGVLGGASLDRLQARLAELVPASRDTRGTLALHAEPQGVVATDASLEDLGGSVERLAAEAAQLDERLAQRESDGRPPAEIALELHEVETRLTEERGRHASLQLAAATLEEVATAVHREVAPRMNARVGEIFAHLSRGRHTEVRLDEDLTPSIRMDADGMYGAESLSGGAADQLFFAMRVTAGEQLAHSGERLPLLLDDPFVQYDPDRLHAALDLVSELARQHQVVFSTCELVQARALTERVEALGLEYDTLYL